MPRNFVQEKVETKQSQKAGVFILIIGGFLLVGGFVGAYFVFFKTEAPAPVPVTQVQNNTKTAQNNSVDNKPNTQTNSDNNSTTKDDKTDDNTPKIDNSKDDKKSNDIINKDDTTTNTININTNKTDDEATSTDIKKATTTDVVSIEKATTTEEKKVEPVIKVYIKAKDSDRDGLTDVEEALFSIDPAKRDSDEDGFDDLAEINNYYNPAGDGELIVNANIEVYRNDTYKYRLFYPYHWDVSDIGDDSSVLFKAPNDQFFQIIVQNNKKGQTIEDWYKDQYDVNFIKSTQKFYKSGWLGIKSEDNLTICLLYPKNNLIFVVTYNTGVSTDLYYPNVFDLFVKSLEIE